MEENNYEPLNEEYYNKLVDFLEEFRKRKGRINSQEEVSLLWHCCTRIRGKSESEPKMCNCGSFGRLMNTCLDTIYDWMEKIDEQTTN